MDWVIIVAGLVAALAAGILIKRWYVALPIIVVILFLSMIGQAQASVKVSWSVNSVQCYRYSVTERRRGVFDIGWLWKLNQSISWCETGTNVWQGPNALRSHWENGTWTWGGYEQRWVRKLTDPVRWQFYVSADFDGLTPTWYVDHDHPWVAMTIWRNDPTHVSYTASCGC